MRILKTVSVAIFVIILLAFTKTIVGKTSLDAKVLLHNILSCSQAFLLSGLFFWLTLLAMARVTRKRHFSFAKSLLIYLCVIVITEIGCSWLLHNAQATPKSVFKYLDEYYREYELTIPERTHECGCYDSTLLYAFKPSASCLYANLEFSTTIHTNRLGLRDDDASLAAPEIICLGDSYTMGWGVEQQETFPQLVEEKTGLKVLNAGISSYGTARETILLKRLDTSKLKFLVIQFYFNDWPENAAYIHHNFTYTPGITHQQYDSIMTHHKWRRAYFPLKRSLTMMRIAWRDVGEQIWNRSFTSKYWKRHYDTTYVQEAAEDFVNILCHAGINFNSTKV
ncbi:MAG TPA: hypothetical protein VFZ47_01920, partial [Chitinophagaceae bacterium]